MKNYNKINSRDIDKLVAINIRNKRISLGLSRAEVAEVIGVSHQQMLKYENNINRISNGRLYILSKFLKTSIYKLMSSH